MDPSKELCIQRLSLRGQTSDVRAARRRFLPALDHTPWPETPAIYRVRSLILRGKVDTLASDLAIRVRQLVSMAVDGWYDAADQAMVVGFSSPTSERACLVRDLMNHRARHRWFWRRHPALAAFDLPSALTLILKEAPRELPDLLAPLPPEHAHALKALADKVLGQPIAPTAPKLPTPASPQAPGITSQRPPTMALPPRPEGEGPQPPLLGPTSARMPLAECISKPDPWAIPAPLAATNRASPTIPTPTLEKRAPDLPEVAPHPRPIAPPAAWAAVVLQTKGPTHAEGNGASAVASRTPSLAPPPSPHPRPPALGGMSMASPPSPSSALPPLFPTAGASSPGARTKIERAPDTTREQGVDARGTLHRTETPTSPTPQTFSPTEYFSTGFLTARGGRFFLLNLLASPTLAPRLEACSIQEAWRLFHALAEALDGPADPPLAAFLADACGVDDALTLSTLPPPVDLAHLLALAHTRYGNVFDIPDILAVPGRVVTTRSHLDIHFRIADARLPLRRLGLDLDPGWLPWLGRVVAFHFGSGMEPETSP